MKSSSIKADYNKNTLHISFAGRVTKKELDSLYTDLRFSVADLKEGFYVISDFSDCQLIYLNGLPTFRRIMHFLVASGVSEVVRVIDPGRVISRQIINLTTRMQGYRPTYAATREEAQKRLVEIVKRDGLRFYPKDVTIQCSRSGNAWEGIIGNISTSGCSMEGTTADSSPGNEMTVSFSLLLDESRSHAFTLNAEVVRTENDKVAFRFLDVDKNTKDQLWKCILFESQRNLDAA